MGSCAVCGQTRRNDAIAFRPDPEPKDVELKGGSTSRIGLVSDSLAYCLLVAPGDGCVFIDARSRAAFDKGHLFGAWCLDGATRTGASLSNEADDKDDTPVTLDEALIGRCSLRTVVICGDTSPLRDEAVLSVLKLLQDVGARPKGHPCVLRGGVQAFSKRFGFCLRKKGEEKARPIPCCPAELLAPGWGSQRPPALYVGTDNCVLGDAETGKVVGALGIRAIINLSGQPLNASKKGCKVVNVQATGAAADGEGFVAAGREACGKVLRQSGPCLLYGPLSALATAFLLVETHPGVARSVDEVEAFIRLRFPQASGFDVSAQAALGSAIAQRTGQPLPPRAPVDTPPAQVAPPAGSTTNSGSAGIPNGGSVPDSKPQTTPVADLCSQFQKRDRKAADVAINTIRVALSNILVKPTEPKYRLLKGSNARVQREVLAHSEAVTLLRLVGFVSDGQDLVLPPPTPLQGLRDLLALLPEVKGSEKRQLT